MNLFYLIINLLWVNLIYLIANFVNHQKWRFAFNRYYFLTNLYGLFWWLLTNNQFNLYLFGLLLIFLSLEDLYNQTAHSGILILFLPLVINQFEITNLILASVLLLLAYQKYLGLGDFLPIFILNLLFDDQQFSILICLTAFLAIIYMAEKQINKIALLPFLSMALLILVTFDKLLQPL